MVTAGFGNKPHTLFSAMEHQIGHMTDLYVAKPQNGSVGINTYDSAQIGIEHWRDVPRDGVSRRQGR